MSKKKEVPEKICTLATELAILINKIDNLKIEKKKK